MELRCLFIDQVEFAGESTLRITRSEDENKTDLLRRGNTGIEGRWMFRIDLCSKYADDLQRVHTFLSIGINQLNR